MTSQLEKIPQHIAFIMDGNGRWATKRKLLRIEGHRKGANTVRMLIKTSRQIGVKYLTIYAFSTENWKRPEKEIKSLFGILKTFIKKERKDLIKNNIGVKFIGNFSKLDTVLQKEMSDLEEATQGENKLLVNIAISYGGREDILQASKKCISDVIENKIDINSIDEEYFSNSLYTAGSPDPDLLIRTSGEIRISNFLLWQIAYSEIIISKKLFPEYEKDDFLSDIAQFSQRTRRFGKTNEQLNKTQNEK